MRRGLARGIETDVDDRIAQMSGEDRVANFAGIRIHGLVHHVIGEDAGAVMGADGGDMLAQQPLGFGGGARRRNRNCSASWASIAVFCHSKVWPRTIM